MEKEIDKDMIGEEEAYLYTMDDPRHQKLKSYTGKQQTLGSIIKLKSNLG